jgi:RNA polymerase sigma-70 factor (ECF subfamily)
MKRMRDFRESVEQHRHRVYTFSFYWLGNAEDAEDVTQEVLFRLWKNWHKVRMDSIKPWLTRVTRNACIDAIRKRRSYRAVVTDAGYEETLPVAADAQPDPCCVMEMSDLQEQLKEALGRLNNPYRTIVILREIQDMTYAEIGASLDMPVNRVKVYLHRGRRMLREQLRERVGHGQI